MRVVCDLVRIDPITHEMPEYPATGICGGVASGPDGALWFTAHHINKIGRFDLSTKQVDEYTVPTTNSNTDNIISGPDGAVWFTEFYAGKIGRIDTNTHRISEYLTPTRNSGPLRIVKGSDGALWFTEAFANKIGQIILPADSVIP